MKFIDRMREHEDNHIRHIDLQTLDVLLRIEELLTTLVAASAFPAATTLVAASSFPAALPDVVPPPSFEDSASAGPTMSQFLSKEDLEEAKKPGGVTMTTKRRK